MTAFMSSKKKTHESESTKIEREGKVALQGTKHKEYLVRSLR